MARSLHVFLVVSILVAFTHPVAAQHHRRARHAAPSEATLASWAAPLPSVQLPAPPQPVVYAPQQATTYAPSAPPVFVPHGPPAPIAALMQPPPPWSEIRHPWTFEASFGVVLLVGLDAFSWKATEAFSYHLSGGIDGFFVGGSVGEIADPTGFGGQLVARIGWDASIADGDGALVFTPYVGAGMVVVHSGNATAPFLDAQLGLDVKRYIGDVFYFVARPLTLDLWWAGGSPLVAWDMTAGVGLSL